MLEAYRGARWAWSGEPQDLVIENGRVTARGPEVAAGIPGAIDRDGWTFAPAWIDNHCHILPCGLDLQKLHLGVCATADDILQRLAERHRELEPGAWLMAVHYDQTKFPDGRHLDRARLDSISPDRPILLRHVSGHASVANSSALAAAGVTDATPDPAGGAFERDSDGKLTGVLLETAHEQVTAAAPDLTLETMVDAIRRAADHMAGFGIACASDMMTGRFDLDLELQAYRIAAEQGAPVRFRLYLQWARVFGPRALDPGRLRELQGAMDPDRCRIAGIKIFADGAIGAATAAIRGRYESSPEAPEGQGQLIYEPDRLREMVRIAHESGWQVAIHSIGDRSTDCVMDAFEALGEGSRRHRLEHAMMLDDAQIERLARLGCHTTMQPEFLVRFGHAYRRQLGEARAARLKRFRSVLDAGIPLSFSSDNPIVEGRPSVGFACAISRPEGFDPVEDAPEPAAWHAYGPAAAAANGDADDMGSLLPGQVADVRWVPPGLPIV